MTIARNEATAVGIIFALSSLFCRWACLFWLHHTQQKEHYDDTTKTEPHPCRTPILDPLADYPEPFRRHLESQHYRPSTIGRYSYCVNVLSRQMRALTVELKDLDEDKAVDLIARSELQKQRPRRRKENAFIIRSFIKFLAGLGSVKPVLASAPDDTARGCLKRDYEEYLRRQRGLSERTIFHSWRVADRFLGFRFGKEIGDLSPS